MYNRYNHCKSSLEAASEAAAKVNAMLIAEGKLKLSQVNQHYTSRAKPGGLYVSEVEINEAPLTCRNILTKGTTQEDIMKVSGAAVSTRGRYLTFEQKSQGADERPLYLYVQATTQQSVNIAIKKINEILKEGEVKSSWMENNNQFLTPPPPLNQMSQPPPTINQMNQPPPPLPQQTHFLRPPPEPAMVTFLQEKLYIGLEHAPLSFDVKNKIIGPAGCYLRHVMSESGAIASLCGKGGGFGDTDSIEPMHIQIQHPTMEGLQNANVLASNLIQTVQQEYAQFQQALAAIPTALTPAPTQMYMGVHRQTTIPGSTLLGPPAIATLTTLTQPSVLPPGMQPGPGIVGGPMMSVSTPSSVMLPAASLTSSLPPPSSMINVQQAGPPVMIPSSMASSYTTMAITAPLVASALTTGQIMSHTIDTGGINSENVVLVPNTSIPPPMLQPPQQPPHQFDINPNNQFIAVPEGQIIMSQPQQQMTVVGPQTVIPPGPLPTLITTPSGQTMELVHQSTPQVPPQPLSIVGQQPPPPFTVRSGQPFNSEIATSTTLTMSNLPPSISHPYTTVPPKEEPKRRFTEEKQDEPIPENLLGYQHGPLHLMNQSNTQQGPVNSDSNNPQYVNPDPNNPPQYVNPDPNNPQFGISTHAFDTTNIDQQMMPPPPPTGLKRAASSSEDEPQNKHEKTDYGAGEESPGTDVDGSAENGNLVNSEQNEHMDPNSVSNDGTLDPHFQPYKVAISSAPTMYTSRAITPPIPTFAQYSQPPPDQPQYVTTGLPPDQQIYTLSSSSLPIHNQSVPVVSIAVPMSGMSQPIHVSSQPMMTPMQPMINQNIPVYSQAVPVTSQPLPVYSQALPVPNQSTLTFRPPSPQNVQWGAPAPRPPTPPNIQWGAPTPAPPPPTSFYNQPPQWNGQNGGLSEPTYSAPTSHASFNPGLFTVPPPPTQQFNQPPPPTSIQQFNQPPPPTSIQQFNQPPPPMPYWVGPN